MDERSHHLPRQGQQGAALLTSLILLLAIMLLGAATASITMQGEKAARNERDFRTAFFAAEAALRDAQADIDREQDASLFLPPDPAAFVNACGTKQQGKSPGLCLPAQTGHPPVWLTVNLLDAGEDSARTKAYGTYTGRLFPAGEGALPFRPPRYLIELLSAPPREPAGEADPVELAGAALAAYPAWCAFATVLSTSTWWLNRDRVSR